MFLVGVVGGVLSKATTVVLVSCSHTRTLFDWSCWWCVVQGHYCCGDVLFSPPGHFLFGTAGGGLSQATTVVIGVLFSPPGHFLNGLLVVGCPRPLLLWWCAVLTTRTCFAWGCWRWVAPRPLLFWWCVVLTTKTLVGCSCCWWFWQRWAGARLVLAV